MEMLLVGVYSHLARERGVLAHASLVELHGQGVMFAGRSGIGKTTQAELWSRYLGARVLNGDKVLLTPREKGYLAWGSPWKGSSPYAVNESAPLKAAVILEQGEENRMERLTSPGCLERFLPHVFYPVWDEAASAGMMEGLDILMSYLPVYRLSCRPDEEAARLAYETIFGAKEP